MAWGGGACLRRAGGQAGARAGRRAGGAGLSGCGPEGRGSERLGGRGGGALLSLRFVAVGGWTEVCGQGAAGAMR